MWRGFERTRGEVQFAAWRVKLLDVTTETDINTHCGWLLLVPWAGSQVDSGFTCVYSLWMKALLKEGAADVLGCSCCRCAGKIRQCLVSVDRYSHYRRLAPNWSSSWQPWKAVGYERWRLLTLAAARLTITAKMTWLSWLTWETFRSSHCPSSSYRSATLASAKKMWAALHPASSPNMAKVRCASPKSSASIVC